MGTSFVEYKEHGFWSRDSYIASWLGTILAELEKKQMREEWLDSLAEHWRAQSLVDGGVMCLGLDDFLNDNDRRDLVLARAKEALSHADPLGLRTGQLFIELLEGKLRTTASSPIDYLEAPRLGNILLPDDSED